MPTSTGSRTCRTCWIPSLPRSPHRVAERRLHRGPDDHHQAMVAGAPKKDSRDAAGRRHGWHGRHGFLIAVGPVVRGTGPRQRGPTSGNGRHQGPQDGAGARQRCRAFCCARAAVMSDAKIRTHPIRTCEHRCNLSSRPRTGRCVPRLATSRRQPRDARHCRPPTPVRGTRATRPSAHAAVRVGRRTTRTSLHGSSGGPLAAQVCPRGVRCLPALRRARARLPAVVCEHCRARGWWPLSCRSAGSARVAAARRMAECAALVEEVFGPRPVRQWVLSFPCPLRFLFDRSHWPGLGIVRRVIAGWLGSSRHRPRQRQCGAVTLISVSAAR